jgi:hypothetical protein
MKVEQGRITLQKFNEFESIEIEKQLEYQKDRVPQVQSECTVSRAVR